MHSSRVSKHALPQHRFEVESSTASSDRFLVLTENFHYIISREESRKKQRSLEVICKQVLREAQKTSGVAATLHNITLASDAI